MTDFPAHPYPWQLQEWQQLNQLLQSSRLPHALMLTGPQGIGKTHFARAFAQLVMCLSPIEGKACGKCRSCELNRAGTHPDYSWIAPEEAGKAIKVDQVRELTETLSKTAQQGGYKVVVLTPAEAMNNNAANALLKSLEEPAAKTLLVLLSNTPSAVLPTIRSRCQIRSFSVPSKEQVHHWLSPLVVGRDVDIEQLILAARGAPLTALSLLEGDALEVRANYLIQWSRLSLGQVSGIEVAAGWYGGDVIALMEWYLGQLHQLTRYCVTRDKNDVRGWPEELVARLNAVNLSVLHRYLEKVLTAKKQLLSGANPNKQMLWEELLLDWTVVVRAK